MPEHISVSHPLTSKSVIVRFAIRDVRNEVSYKKQFIRNKNVVIREHLTKRNAELLNTVKKIVGPSNAWTSQTKIYGKIGKQVHRIKCGQDLNLLNDLRVKFDAAQVVDSPPVVNNQPNMNNGIDLNSTQPTGVQATSINDLLQQNWPSLSQADVIKAINDFQAKSNRNNKINDRGHKNSTNRMRSSGRFSNHRMNYNNSVTWPPAHRAWGY